LERRRDVSDRVELNASDSGTGDMYRWFTSSLIPRAIAWVSSTSADGVDNVAPHSFTTVVATDPPSICFVSMGVKDTLINIRETGEFVINIGSEPLLAAMNDSATAFPGAVSEFDVAGIAREPSVHVRPPRVAAAPVVFECKASAEYAVGNGFIVIGEVLLVAASPDVLAEDGLPDAALLAPLARLGRSEWGTLNEVVTLERITLGAWDKGVRSDPLGGA
jgi:flavin reductase (DIM6/NTAB) family NADH-FMN oxidoreductase RutF